MKSFLLAMLVGVGVATVAALALARAAFPETTGEAIARPRAVSGGQAGYSPQDAIETVAARLGQTPKAERLKQSLRLAARAEYHSPGHWTVHFNEANWLAHGTGDNGPYAEPNNEAAELFEYTASGP